VSREKEEEPQRGVLRGRKTLFEKRGGGGPDQRDHNLSNPRLGARGWEREKKIKTLRPNSRFLSQKIAFKGKL